MSSVCGLEHFRGACFTAGEIIVKAAERCKA